MYNVNSQPIFKYKSTIYISKKLESIIDEEGNEITQYSEPVKYRFNVQNVDNDSEIREFGELSTSMKVASITEKSKYLNKFKDFDLAYIETKPSDEEIDYGDNADYRIYAVRNQNTQIRVYFLKLV